MLQTKGQFSAGKIYQAIKAWASKQFLVFNSEAAKDYFRFVLISEISEHDVGLEMLDNVYNGWTIRNSYSNLEICPVINNEEQYPIITVSRAKTTFTTVIEGITPTANNHLATKSYVDSKSINFPGNPQYLNRLYLDADGNFNSPFNSVTVRLLTDGDGSRMCAMKEGNQSIYTSGSSMQTIPIYKQNSDSFALENYKMTSGSFFNVSESGVAIGTNTVTIFNTGGDAALAVTNLKNPNVGLFEVHPLKSVFTTVVEGVTPTANNHLTTKAYTDTADTATLNSAKSYTDTSVNAVKTVTDAVKSKSLKNIYNSTLTANKLLCTDSSGYVTTQDKYSVNNTLSMSGTQISMPNKLSSALAQNLYKCAFDQQGRCTSATAVTIPTIPHLYVHKYHYDHGGKGEVNFVIITTKSTQMGADGLGDYLNALNCTVYYRAYPATGQGQLNGGWVAGIYAVAASHFLKWDLYVSTYTINGNYQEMLMNYDGTTTCSIIQLF